MLQLGYRVVGKQVSVVVNLHNTVPSLYDRRPARASYRDIDLDPAVQLLQLLRSSVSGSSGTDRVQPDSPTATSAESAAQVQTLIDLLMLVPSSGTAYSNDGIPPILMFCEKKRFYMVPPSVY